MLVTSMDYCTASLHHYYRIYTFLRSSAAIAVKDNNGTFVSTLSLILYNVSELDILFDSALKRENIQCNPLHIWLLVVATYVYIVCVIVTVHN